MSGPWKHLYDAQEWNELDHQWWFSEDKAALTKMFNWLVENIPKAAIDNGTESVFQPISSRDATFEWTYVAGILEQGELERTNLGDPVQASVVWQDARANALATLDHFIESEEPTKGDKRPSRRRHAELGRACPSSNDLEHPR